jgi:3-phenylpropionate/cinnamic acid dioxygenase small subunit
MTLAAAPGLAAAPELRQRLGDLYCDYCDALDDGEYERWPDFFTEACLYKVVPRENFARNLPIGLIYCESRAMLKDRVVALKETALFAPRIMRHMVSGVRIRALDRSGIRMSANFTLIETLVDQPSQVFLCGTYLDLVVEDGGALRFAEKLCVYDSTIVPTSLIFPI